jgi:hypothetical protein
MYQQCRFRVLVGLLVLVSGCTHGEANDGTMQGADDAATEGTDAETTEGTDTETSESSDGGSTEGPDDGAELDWEWEWAPLVSDEILVDQMPVPRPSPGRWPVAAFDGNQYLVVWNDYRALRPILYGGRITADGTELDPFGFPILDIPSAGGYQPSVAFDGINFLIVTGVGAQILGVRVSPAGEVLDPGGIIVAENGGAPSLAFDGEQYLVAWSNGGIYRARVQPDGTVLDPGGVLTYPLTIDTTRVGVSFDGANHLLSWVDRDDQWQNLLNGGRVAADGTLLDETPIFSQIGSSLSNYLSPVAGFDGTNHVIAWGGMSQDEEGYDQYQIFAVRVTPEGASLDPDGIPIITESVEAKSVHRLEIAARGGSSDVVWSMDYSGEGGPGAFWIGGARIAPDGTTSLHPEQTFPGGLEATLAVDPNGALLLWRDGSDLWDDSPAITGMRLDGAGLPMDESVVAPARPASRQDVKAVASDGHNFFVLWTDTREPIGEGKALFGARVGADGMPLDPEPIEFAVYGADLADVVFDGANFVVTWVHFSGGEGDGNPFHTVRVSPAGELLDIMPLPIPLSHMVAGASDGTHTLLVGRDSESWENVLAAALLDQQGVVTSDVVHILDEDQGYGSEPAVSFDGLEYLVVWLDLSAAGQRINQAGALEGPRFPILNHYVDHVATAAGAGIHLVVAEGESGIWATRVGPGGQVLDPDGYLVAEPGLTPGGCWKADVLTGSCPSVVFDGENFIVAWRAPSIPGDASSLELYAAKLSPEGEVSSHVAISQGPEREGRPFLAIGDEGVRATYNDFVPGPPYDARRAVGRLIVP